MLSLNNIMNKTIKKILGVIFIVIGVIGLILPFIQGIILIIAGSLLIDGEDFGEIIKKFKQKIG